MNHEGTTTEMLVREEGAAGGPAVPVSLRTEPMQTAFPATSVRSGVVSRRQSRKEYMRKYSKYYETTPKRKAYLKANKERRLAYVRKWKQRNPEAKQRQDNYVSFRAYRRLDASQVRRYLKRKIANPTPNQIESCKRRIQIHRTRKLLRLMAAASAISNLSATLTES